MRPTNSLLGPTKLCTAPGPVDFALVIDFDFDLDFAADRAESAELALFGVVMRCVELGVVSGKLDRGDDQVILLVRRSVSAEDEPMKRIVLSLGPEEEGMQMLFEPSHKYYLSQILLVVNFDFLQKISLLKEHDPCN